MRRPEELHALSNMPLVGSSEVGGRPGWWEDQFATSLPMSAYLVALALTDYQGTVNLQPS